jgi:hypothetical protein
MYNNYKKGIHAIGSLLVLFDKAVVATVHMMVTVHINALKIME